MTKVYGPEGLSDEPTYYPEMQAMIDRLFEDPTLDFECIHGDGLAVGLYETPKGCVVFREATTQPLCPQHVVNGGDIAGMYQIVDLSPNAVWSKRQRTQSDYWRSRDPSTGEVKMVKFADEPFEIPDRHPAP